jgi:hypothetical protein
MLKKYRGHAVQKYPREGAAKQSGYPIPKVWRKPGPLEELKDNLFGPLTIYTIQCNKYENIRMGSLILYSFDFSLLVLHVYLDRQSHLYNTNRLKAMFSHSRDRPSPD